jgi:hypothetical protein
MTTSTRLAPVRRDVRRPPPPLRVPEPPRSAPARRGPPSFERVLVWSILAAAAVHLLILLVSPLLIRQGAGPAGIAQPGAESDPEPLGMEWIIPIPSDAAEEREAMTDAEAPAVAAERTPSPIDRDRDLPRALQVRPGTGADRAEGPLEERRSVGETLRPGFTDGRLYVDPRELRIEREPSRHEQYMAHLQARIDALNDSTYGGGPNTDWTHTDAEGRRWGVSPEGVHLGGLTIPRWLLPLPQSTGTNQDIEADRERRRQRDEIIRQEDDRAREEARERARKAAEERRKRGGGGGEDGR